MGDDPLADMNLFIKNKEPVVFDIGANVGHATKEFRAIFPKSFIHAFEPSPDTFKLLLKNTNDLKNVLVWNCGIGSVSEKKIFYENSNSEMSSFRQLSQYGWGDIRAETIVPIRTIDQFCKDERIEQIDILKTDTQGFELEVLRGAENMLLDGKVTLVYCEIIFSDMYKDTPSYLEIFKYLESRDFYFVSFYNFYYQRKVASYSDALFVHKTFLRT